MQHLVALCMDKLLILDTQMVHKQQLIKYMKSALSYRYYTTGAQVHPKPLLKPANNTTPLNFLGVARHKTNKIDMK
jgi:hypothetical protein